MTKFFEQLFDIWGEIVIAVLMAVGFATLVIGAIMFFRGTL